MIGIYKITNPKGKIYIGQTIDHERRFRHYNGLKCIEQPRLYRSFLKYGVDNHIFKFIKECEKDELTKWERQFQELYNSAGKGGLNCILVSTDEFSGGHSEESKNKISKSLKGRKFSIEHRAKIGLENKKRVISDETRFKLGNGNRGKNFSDEWRKNLSNSQVGKTKSNEIKRKISQTMSGRKISEEHRQKLKNRVITDEWRMRLSQAAKNRNK